MNATDTTYNPFRAAAAAAFAELSSESAQRFYALKAQKDIQNVLDTSITLCAWAFQLAQLTYMMGVQCRAWCDALEANAQTPVRPVLMLAPARIEEQAAEDPWEVEAEYKFIEFSPSVAAQAFTSPMLMLSPASTPPVFGKVWNPAPGRNMHEEVARLHQLQSVPLMLAPATAQEQPAPEPVKQPARKGRGQTRAASAPANAIDELAMALDVPGAIGGKQRKSRAKAGSSKAAAKPKAKARAKTEVQ